MTRRSRYRYPKPSIDAFAAAFAADGVGEMDEDQERAWLEPRAKQFAALAQVLRCNLLHDIASYSFYSMRQFAKIGTKSASQTDPGSYRPYVMREKRSACSH